MNDVYTRRNKKDERCMSIKTITVQELKEKIDQREKIVIIDCREPYEWELNHITKSILIPSTKIEAEFKKAGNPKAELIVYCQSGARSIAACFTFLQNGYENVSNLEGGINKWISSGGEVLREKK